MDIAQLRYPVAYWDGTPPLHRITCLAITPPVTQSQRVLDSSRADGDADSSEKRGEVRQYAITGSSTGELVHWEIHQHDQPPPPSSSPSSLPNGHGSATTFTRTFHPRALLLRQGSARLTCALRVSLSELDTFLVGSVEGFLTLWTATAGRCVKSSLVLPFSPSTLLAYQREVKVKVGRVREAGVDKGGRSRMVHRSYAVCCSVQSPYVYVVQLPHLKVVKVLKHSYEVASVAIAHLVVKKPTNPTPSKAPSSSSTTASAPSTASSSASSSSSTATPVKAAAAPAPSTRAVLHCLTIGGTLHRWDLLDLTAQEAPLSSSTAPEDESNRELLLTKTKASVIKLPFPSLALPSGLPPTVSSPAGSASASFPAALAASTGSAAAAASTSSVPPSPSRPPFFPVACALSTSGNLVLLTLPRHFCVYSMLTRALETPLLPLSALYPHSPSSSFSGCHFLPSFLLASVLTLRVLLWTTDGDIALVSISTTASEDGGPKKVIVVVLATFTVDPDSSDPPPHDKRPTAVTVDGDRIVAGTPSGEVVEWVMPASLIPHLSLSSFVSPFTSGVTFVATPSFPSSTLLFPVALTAQPVVVAPAYATSVSSAFTPSSARRLFLSTLPSDPCTTSVLLTEGSGKAVLLARGFSSGVIRVYGPASRSPASPTVSPHKAQLMSPSSSFTSSMETDPSLPDATVIELSGHSGAISCLLSIGGREFSCNHAMMASGSADMTVCVWDVSRATLLKRIRLSYPVASLHRPALTLDDYQYYYVEQQGRGRGDNGLVEAAIKEQYQQTMDNKPFAAPDVIATRTDEPVTDTASNSSSPPSRTRALTVGGEEEDATTAGLGVLFVSCVDLSIRVFSLQSHLLLQTFRGHDAPTLTVFRDLACMREEQIIVQTERHSVYVWSMVDGSLTSYLTGDEGAIPFLQMRGLIAPGSQLSILAHHIRQRMKRIARSSTLGEKDGDASRERGDSGGSYEMAKVEEEKEGVKDDKLGTGERIRDRFHLRSKSTHNLQSIAASASSTSATSAQSASVLPGFPSTSTAPLVHSQHVPSSHAMQHPAASFLSSHRPIDRTTQHLLLSSIVRGDAGQHDGAGGTTGDADSSDSHANHPSPNPRSSSTGLPKATLLKRASSIMETRSTRGDIAKEREDDASTSSTIAGTSSSDAPHDLHIPLIDPYMGTKKLKRTIDVVRMEGKVHLHVSLFVINLNRFIRDLQRRYLQYQRRSQPSSPSASSTSPGSSSPSLLSAPTPHAPSLNHLAVEALDPTPQEELSYLLSTLFDWDESSATTQMLREHFQLHSPFPVPCYATITDNSQALTVLFPSYCRGFRRWQLDADMTARQALAIASVCMPLLASVDVTSQTYFSKIVAQYTSLLPMRLEGYVEPDVSVLALFSVNSNEQVQSSARLLLQGVIERASPERRRELSDQWSSYYTYPVTVEAADTASSRTTLISPHRRRDTSPPRSSAPGTGYVSDQEMMTALVLTLIGQTEISQSKYARHDDAAAESTAGDKEREDAVREATLATFESVAPHLTNTLLRVLTYTGASHDNDVVKCVLAADLLSRSLPLFLAHITRPEAFIHRLYLLSMAKQQSLSATAYRCLLEYGKLDPPAFLTCMGREALSAKNSTHVRQSAFLSIASLVKRHALSLARSLPSAVSVCVACLDPKDQAVRKTLMNSSLAALHALVQQYPLVAMHHGTQRFAVASSSATSPPRPSILLYDLQKAERVKTFEGGHRADITALAFSAHGSLLASYCATENPPCIKVWTVAEVKEGGLFGRLMGGGAKDAAKDCVKTFTLSSIAPPSRANAYYSGAHSTIGLKWAEEEDRGFKMARSKSRSRLAGETSGRSLTLTIPAGEGVGSRSSSSSPTHSPLHHSPLSSPALRRREKPGGEALVDDEDENGGEMLPSVPEMTFQREYHGPAGAAASGATHAGAGDGGDEDEDEEIVRQLVLKCMLTVKLEWKDDNEVTIARENGEKKTFHMDK